MSVNLRTIDLVAAASFIGCLALFLRKSAQRSSLPPGPPADPLIGHLRSIPTEKMAETFHEWSKTYGDVMYVKVPGREMVILGSAEVAQALLDAKGANYSCRPKLTVFELMGWNPTLTFMQYGKRFLKHRKMLQQYFGRKESLAFNDILAEEARYLVKNLTKAHPGQHLHYAQRFTLSNIMRAAFGHRVKSDDDKFERIAHGVTYALNNCGPAGSTPVDLFPWLRHFPSWFPGAYYASVARSHFCVIRELHDVILEFVQEGMKTRSIEKCFASEKLEELGDHADPESIDDVRGAAATILAGGEDTTYASLTTFLLAMVLHPECQQRAYEEIISVVGQDRLPDLSDRASLPYIDCVLQESLRWHVVPPLGVPHRAMKDDVFNGMFIPEGAVVLANIGGMSIDERVYSNPKVFNPSRYLGAPEGREEPFFSAVWGFGRRICPGRHFADVALWNALACILATLEIVPVKDEAGNPKMPKVEFSEGLISQARPFEFEARPRSDAARALIAHIDN
ncbi:hypothetical protein V5O48_003771 [Marasmius crinis-equi]|uniref:Cytochrome P450 n=1 Tax=Marasmius crinis-equi TaxID=585013 RepID=A0ABR3FRZ1_9AGAR